MSESVDTSAEAVRVTNPGYAEYLNSPAGKIITEQREQIVSLQSSLTAAQQRIADLEAQCANDATLSTALDAVIAERDAAFAQVDALRVNARRYEWLRDSCPPVSAYHHLQHSPSECDARIDAAMAAKGDDWLTREARQIGLHSPACASFGQNECDCGAKP